MSVMNPTTARTNHAAAAHSSVQTLTEQARLLMEDTCRVARLTMDARDPDDKLDYIADVFAKTEFFYSAAHDQFDINEMYQYIQTLYDLGVFEIVVEWASEQFKTSVAELNPTRLTEFMFPRDRQQSRRYSPRSKRFNVYNNPERSGLMIWLNGVTVQDTGFGGHRNLRFINEDGTPSEIGTATRLYLKHPIGEEELEIVDQKDVARRVRRFDTEAADEIEPRTEGDITPSGGFGKVYKIGPEVIDSVEVISEVNTLLIPDLAEMNDSQLHNFLSDIMSEPCVLASRLKRLVKTAESENKLRPETADQIITNFNQAREAVKQASDSEIEHDHITDHNDRLYAYYVDKVL